MNKFFEHSREDLVASIAASLQALEFGKVLHCLAAAKMSVEDVGNAMHEISDPLIVGKNIVSALCSRLDRVGFISSSVGQFDTKEIFHKFDEAEAIWLYLINQLFMHYEHNVDAVEEYRSTLQNKRTQSIGKDKWGEIDESGWAAVLKEFAEEKMLGGSFEIGLEALPVVLRSHFLKVNAFNLVPRFAWIIFTTGQTKASAKNVGAEGTMQKGVRFEHELRLRIEEGVSDALVEMTPGSGDQGADLIVYINGLKIVIQAKNYTSNVGNSAVQEVHAAKGFYEADVAMVVTNSDYTHSAKELAGELDVLLVFDSQIVTLLNSISD